MNENPLQSQAICDYKGDYTCQVEFFVIGCLLPLVQGDYKVCSHMCPWQLKFCLLQLKL
jgi:hypothetical protein